MSGRLRHEGCKHLDGGAGQRAEVQHSAAGGAPLYRSSANSTSVITPARRQSRAKKNTVSMPLMRKFHQSQFPATPFFATSPVTTSGVSAAKVVATMLAPASHQLTLRPDRKYCSMLSPPFFVKRRPMPIESAK